MFSISAINPTLNILVIVYYNNFYFYCYKMLFDAFKIVVVWRHLNLWMQGTNVQRMMLSLMHYNLQSFSNDRKISIISKISVLRDCNSKMKTYLDKHYSKKNFAFWKVRRFEMKVKHALQVGIWTILRRFVSWA